MKKEENPEYLFQLLDEQKADCLEHYNEVIVTKFPPLLVFFTNKRRRLKDFIIRRI